MRKFSQNKLWRDGPVNFLENYGSIIHWRRLDDEEFKKELCKKLVEEAMEVDAAKNKKEFIEELGDVFEVIDSLLYCHGITKEEIIKAQKLKKEQKGGFEGRKFVETAEHPKNSLAENYCLLDPKKYPEII